MRSITSRPSNDDTVIVAGTFAGAGLLTCEAVCAWSVANKQWSVLGTGIKGSVSSVAYAGVRVVFLLPLTFELNSIDSHNRATQSY